MSEKLPRTGRLAGILVAAGFALAWGPFPSALGQSSGSARLEKLRLLPPVLLKGEKGWSLEERMRQYKVEAVSVAVVADFKVLWTEARGFADRMEKAPATVTTLFQAGSISKPVAAAGVLREVEAGRLALDRDVNEYLKSWKVPENGLTAKRKVTLERILSHSAGLTVHGFPGYDARARVPSVPQVLDGAAPANTAAVRVDLEPGSKFRYSGGGYTVAQLVLTDVSGKPFPQQMRELVLTPAGMTQSTYEQPLPPEKLRLAAAGYRRDGSPVAGKRHTYPEMAAAGLWTTSEDLARFGVAIARSLRGEKGALLSKKMAERMTTPFAEAAGLGFFIEKHGGEAYFGHDGADEGFQAALIMNRKEGYGAAVMANSDNGIALAKEILRGIAQEQGWKGYLPEPIPTIPVPPEELRELPGRYQLNGDEAFTLAARDGRLFGRPSPEAEEYELFAASNELFVRKDRPTRYRVERSPAGGVAGIVLVTETERVVARRAPDGLRLPSDALREDKIEEAMAGYRKIFSSNPNDPAVAEGRLNDLGYQLAVRTEFAKAIAILELNTELYPTSSNTYDSLAEICLASGDRRRSLENYKRVLEILPKDSKTDPSLKERLRQNAETRIRELEGSSAR